MNPTSTAWERALYRPLEYLGNLLCTRNICASETERRLGLEMGLGPARKLVAIANGIDPSAFEVATSDSNLAVHRSELRSRLGWPEHCFIVGSTSRLVPGKDNATLVRAMARVAADYPDLDVRLVLAGDGEERDEILELIRHCKIEDRVALEGFVQDIPAFLAGLDVWACATLTEGLSVSLLEALAAGLPVVTTAIPANAEVVDDGVNGILVEVGRADLMATACVRLATDSREAERLATAGRVTVTSDYSVSRMFSETYELYRDLLAVSGKPFIKELLP